MPEQGKPELPASQKAPLTGPPTKTANAGATENPKTTSTGTTKDPKTESSLSSDASAKAAGVVTEDKTSKKAEEEEKENEPLEKHVTELKGEILQGDSFRITLVRGNKTIQIPVPLESSRDVITMDNTFKIISEVMKVGTEKELDEKFHSYIKQ